MTRPFFVSTVILALGLMLPTSSLAQKSNLEPPTPTKRTSATEKQTPLDITVPANRGTRGSAYTLPGGRVELRTGLFGTSSDELFGALGAEFGVGGGVQLGMNVLHAGAGLLNLRAKWNFLKIGPWAFSAAVSPVWINGSWVWLQSGGEVIGNIDVVMLPFSLTTSVFALDWLQLDLEASYVDVEVFGSLNSDSLVFDTDLAVRGFYLHPSARVHLHKRVTISASARLPVWSRVPGTIEAEVALSPGVVAGARSAGARTIPFKETYGLNVVVRSMISQKLFLGFGLNYGPLPDRLYGSPLYPELSLEARF